MDIRPLKPSDIPHVQQANITNLPENYFCKYYMYHALTWPQLSYVAVDVSIPVSVFSFGLRSEEGVMRVQREGWRGTRRDGEVGTRDCEVRRRAGRYSGDDQDEDSGVFVGKEMDELRRCFATTIRAFMI